MNWYSLQNKKQRIRVPFLRLKKNWRDLNLRNKTALKTWGFFFFFCCGAATQRGSWPPNSWGFLDHTQRRTTASRTPLDEWSTRHKDLYLTTHKTHNRQTSMPPVGFEPTISASEQPQTYALDRTVTGTGLKWS